MAQRIRQSPDPDASEPRLEPQPPGPAVAEAGPEQIGRLLRRAREGYGQDLVAVAAQLRIRAIYLDAIEKGRFEDLPGKTYALGFVRSYAEYLGLDGADLVRRFRDEAAGLHAQTQLVFPALAEEGRLPRGLILLLSAALALFAYGGWYYFSNREPGVAEMVPQVPERLAGEISPTEAAPTPAADPATIEPPPPTATAEAPEGAEPGPVEPPPPATEIAAGDSVPPIEEPADETTPTESTVPADFADGSPAEPTDAAAAATPSAVAAAIPAAPVGAVSEGMEQALGATNVDSRIVVRARLESWVQISDAGNAPLFTRVLRAGDSYQVPNQAGLTLSTGNAGGLEISVDGATAPALGPVGVVRRGIPLDPDRLRDGTAAAP
ncbi:MAG: helix-turn-helix domain-containing protein [Dongiaceae bacterium]